MGQTFEHRSTFPVPVSELWKWHERPGAFERLNPPWDPVEVVERKGGLEVGARTVIKMKIGPVPQTWVADHTACEKEVLFRDEQTSGPFKKWVHTHRFSADGAERSVLEDSLEIELPMGALGEVFAGNFTRHTLERTFNYRHAITALDLSRHRKFSKSPALKVAITGASGMLGTSLSAFLSGGGHQPGPVKRKGDQLDPSSLEGADAVVHLAGANVGERWTKDHKVAIRTSRIDYTRQLIAALAGLKKKPKVLVAANAVGIYGDRGDEVLTEKSPIGARSEKGAEFLVGICEDWEKEVRAAEALGIRVVIVRIGVVLTPRGGALAKLLPPALAGAGGPIGDGSMFMSWVCQEDLIGLIHHALMSDGLAGVFNGSAPNPVQQKEFAHTLGAVVHRPSFLPVPKFALRAAFGEMADGTVLASQRALPEAAIASGFEFAHPTLESCLKFCLGR